MQLTNQHLARIDGQWVRLHKAVEKLTGGRVEREWRGTGMSFTRYVALRYFRLTFEPYPSNSRLVRVKTSVIYGNNNSPALPKK